MQKNPEKEKAELWAFDHFRQLYAAPDGRVDSGDESPDIVIHTPEQRIGIEIADIQHGSGKRGSKVK